MEELGIILKSYLNCKKMKKKKFLEVSVYEYNYEYNAISF